MTDTLFHATTIQPSTWKLEGPLVTRTRVLRLMNNKPYPRVFSWIVGPFGSGKSTIAHQWALELDTNVQLVSARPELIEEGGQRQAPTEFGVALRDLLNICSREPAVTTKAVIAEALDRVVELSGEQDQPFILDDLELIRRDAPDTLHVLFQEALPRLKVSRGIFISRTFDANVLGSLQAPRSLRMILPSTLEFDLEETATAHRLGVFGSATMEQVAWARERSAGWIAGMISDLHGHGGRTVSRSEFSTDVLNNMVLQQPPLILRVMLSAALLPVNSMEIWTKWFTHLSLPHWRLPSTLTQLPTRAIDEDKETFEIVPAMRDALVRLVRTSVSQEDIAELLAIAMDWYIHNDDLKSALELAAKRGLETEYLQLIKPMAVKFARTEDWQEIARLVEGLPIKVITSDADISFWYTYALAGETRWSDVIDIQSRGNANWSTSESELVRGRNLLMIGSIARAQGNYEEALRHFEQAYETLPESAHQERMYAAASAGTSVSQIRLGQESLPWRKRTAYELAHLPPRQRWWHGNMGPIALGYVASSGRLELAYTQAEQQVAGLKDDHPDLSWRYLLLMATIDIERMRFGSAAGAIEQAKKYIQTPLQQQMVLHAESKLLAAQGQYTSAMDKLGFRPYSAGRSINNEFITKLTMASQAFDSGDAATAEIALGSAAWPSDSWPRNFGDSHPNLILALVRAETGEVEQGVELAQQVLEEAMHRRFRSIEIRSHVVLAHIYHQCGDSFQRDREVQAANTLNTTAGYQLIFHVQGKDVRDYMNEKPTGIHTHNPANRLTSREIQVLELVAQSLSNKQIAEEMYISVSTVKNHLTSVYDKLGTNNRRAAVQIARAHGIITQ